MFYRSLLERVKQNKTRKQITKTKSEFIPSTRHFITPHFYYDLITHRHGNVCDKCFVVHLRFNYHRHDNHVISASSRELFQSPECSYYKYKAQLYNGKKWLVKGNKQTNIIGGLILRSVIVPPIVRYYVIWVQYDDL